MTPVDKLDTEVKLRNAARAMESAADILHKLSNESPTEAMKYALIWVASRLEVEAGSTRDFIATSGE